MFVGCFRKTLTLTVTILTAGGRAVREEISTGIQHGHVPTHLLLPLSERFSGSIDFSSHYINDTEIQPLVPAQRKPARRGHAALNSSISIFNISHTTSSTLIFFYNHILGQHPIIAQSKLTDDCAPSISGENQPARTTLDSSQRLVLNSTLAWIQIYIQNIRTTGIRHIVGDYSTSFLRKLCVRLQSALEPHLSSE